MEEEKNQDQEQPLSTPPFSKGIPDVPEMAAGLEDRIRRFLSNPGLRRAVRRSLFIMAAIAVMLLTAGFLLYTVPFITGKIPVASTKLSNNPELKSDASYKRQVSLLSRDIQRLTRKYNGYTSGQSYIVINTTENKFLLYRNRKLVRDGFCSSGSYTLLKTAEGDRKWIFRTPKGKYHIQGKLTNPVWRKPDWAFVEEGLPIPPGDHSSRFERGVLGDYALAIGDGYLIHGTIYKRFLGMPVTHGCVRLNDEDLEAIFNTLNVGSKVYIF